MRKKDSDGIWVVIMVLMMIIGLGGSIVNTLLVCKKQDVFWVKGTQYSCAIFK